MKQLERRLEEATAVSGADASRASGLLCEAQAVGLLPAGDLPSEAAAMLAALRGIRFTPMEQQDRLSEQITALRQERSRLQREYERLQREVAEAEEYAAESEGFVQAATELRVRLESLNLFGDGEQASSRCPLCESDVGSGVPRAAQVRSAIEGLQQHIQAAGRERPDLRDYIAGKSSELIRLGSNYGPTVTPSRGCNRRTPPCGPSRTGTTTARGWPGRSRCSWRGSPRQPTTPGFGARSSRPAAAWPNWRRNCKRTIRRRSCARS